MGWSTFTIEGTLPGMNEIISEAKKHWGNYSKFKRKWDDYVSWFILKNKVPVFEKPIKIHITWIERNRKRDRSNIEAGTKFILDALVKTRRIKNDTAKWIPHSSYTFGDIDKENPRIEVSICSV